MPQPNDLSRSLVALDQNSTIIAVIEMSQSSWLVAGMLPGIERQPRHVALQFGQGVWRQRHAFRGVYACKTLGGLAQGWFEVANPQPGQGGTLSGSQCACVPPPGIPAPGSAA